MRESDLIQPTIDLLESKGFYAIQSPDRTDYYDIVAVMGDPKSFVLLCIELKLSSPKQVYIQAFKRNFIFDGTMICMPKYKSILTVKKYDQSGVMGLIHLDGDKAIWVRAPVIELAKGSNKATRDRIAGVVFALKEGIIDKTPTATFTYRRTSYVCGVKVKDYIKDWPIDIQHLINGDDVTQPPKYRQMKLSEVAA